MEEEITLVEDKQKQTDSSIYRSLYFQEENKQYYLWEGAGRFATHLSAWVRWSVAGREGEFHFLPFGAFGFLTWVAVGFTSYFVYSDTCGRTNFRFLWYNTCDSSNSKIGGLNKGTWSDIFPS